MSVINILSSAKESTSYHLKLLSLNSELVGSELKVVPSFVIALSIEITLLSGNITSKNGTASSLYNTFLKTFVTPFLTISLFTKV